ncbi:MAG: hypothetical protein NC408_04655 [Candidatus Gastranaerophilales bacterium]|nr:hypothetical protein [Candidatus Gastranaerophilales bacterium]
MGEYFKAYRKHKKLRAKRNNKYEPKLIALGAVKKSEAVYELDGWFCYPTKGFAMYKKDCSKRLNLNKFINRMLDYYRLTESIAQ